MEAKERALWSTGIGVIVLGVAVAIVLIALVRYSDLPAEPWVYVGVVIGILSAVGGGILTLIRAREVSD
jgi:hypothetical protein